jgi:predicted nucleic acid-binding protein
LTVISDTGPIIALAKTDNLHLLKSFFGEVTIPKAVYKEFMAGFGHEQAAIDEALAEFIHVFQGVLKVPKSIKNYIDNLGRGEREVILMAYNWQNVLVIVDDKSARNAAKSLGISVTGTVGLVLKAKSQGLIEHSTNLLLKMRSNGYWLSDKIISEARKMASE